MKLIILFVISSFLFSCGGTDTAKTKYQNDDGENVGYNTGDLDRNEFESKTFYYNSSAETGLSVQAEEYLNKLVAFLKANPNINISVVGHSDAQGTLAEQEERAAGRAEAVADFLMLKGIKGYRILHMGMGANRPVSEGDTPEGQKLNRRVEINIIEE